MSSNLSTSAPKFTQKFGISSTFLIAADRFVATHYWSWWVVSLCHFQVTFVGTNDKANLRSISPWFCSSLQKYSVSQRRVSRSFVSFRYHKQEVISDRKVTKPAITEYILKICHIILNQINIYFSGIYCLLAHYLILGAMQIFGSVVRPYYFWVELPPKLFAIQFFLFVYRHNSALMERYRVKFGLPDYSVARSYQIKENLVVIKVDDSQREVQSK